MIISSKKEIKKHGNTNMNPRILALIKIISLN